MPLSGDGRPVVVAGEALVDLLARKDGSVEARGGGGPFNAARTVGRLGQPAVFLGVLSEDVFGKALRASLKEAGVGVDPRLMSPLPTTLALAEIDGDGSATYRFYVSETSAPSLTATRAAAMPDDAHSLHIGALGLVFEPIATTLLSLAESARDTAIISVDPNCRPHAIKDLDAYRGVVARAVASAHLVKLSEEDAEVLLPGIESDVAAKRLLDQGPRLVVLTRGQRGATAFCKDWRLEIAAPSVEVVDTVGAGDAFSGALLAHLRRGDYGVESLANRTVVRAALQFATEVAAVVCARRGADPPRLADLGGAQGRADRGPRRSDDLPAD